MNIIESSLGSFLGISEARWFMYSVLRDKVSDSSLAANDQIEFNFDIRVSDRSCML